jgi:uncharacterized protein DUF6978
MLSQLKADELLAMPKVCDDNLPVMFPIPDSCMAVSLKSVDGRESFVADINRKGRMKLSKCTFQKRYCTTIILLRLDVDGPPHTNPDGVFVPCPHLHRYREGWDDQWADPLPPSFSDPERLERTFWEFLTYCNVKPLPEVQRTM